MAKTSKFWGAVAAVASGPVAIAAGVAKGAHAAATGTGSFGEVFDKTATAVIDSAEEFGEEHGEAITSGLVKGAAVAIGGAAVNQGMKHPK